MTEHIKNNKRTLIVIVILLVIGFLFLYASRDNQTDTIFQDDVLVSTSSLDEKIARETDGLGNIDDENKQDNSEQKVPVGFDEEKFPVYEDIMEDPMLNPVPPPDLNSFPEADTILITVEEAPELYGEYIPLAIGYSSVELENLTIELIELQQGIAQLLDGDIAVIQNEIPELLEILTKLLNDLNSYVKQFEMIENNQ